MASSSTSSARKNYMYDVFLSFRGEDVRKNFIDHLYVALQRQGIYTYKDDERLGRGKRINNELLNSIEESKLFIVVFSMNYASSSWCLDELVKIMECQKTTSEQIAYPLFYDVDPSEVRKQNGSVGKAFSRHKNTREAGKWREALKEAANLSGWDLRNTSDGHEAKVIKKMVEDISLELRFNNLRVDDNLVGMERRIRSIVSSSEMGVKDVRMIGIKGIGGGGKTTLAKAVFDKICFSFEGKIFVENVRNVSSSGGLLSLQKQVLSDVLKDTSSIIGSVHEGKSVMRKMLCGKRLLLILDDVDHLEQLEALVGGLDWFLPGSRIIITTRDEQVLVAHGVKCIHDVNLLSQDEALCLFSRYTFCRDIPIQSYDKLSLQVVHYAAGLPLTIRVLGSFLCGKDELEWKDALRRLKTIPLQATLEKLELSYIGLEDDYKEIFLDVACLLKGWNKDHALRALESCGFHARIGLRVLEQKSLLTISSDQKLVMHDSIEEMGQNIARRSHLKNSRLWILEEIEEAVADDLVGASTRAIAFDNGVIKDMGNILSSNILGKGFGNMKKLRFLYVSIWVYYGNHGYKVRHNLPNSLCYLSWHGYTHFCLPKTFQGNNLVALDVSHSDIRRLWEDQERKVLKKLKFLNFSHTKLETLDCSLFPNLEELNLESCSDLDELHVPIGCLRKLIVLCLESCTKLISFSFIKQLTSLQVLGVSYTNLTDFPMHSNYSLVKLDFVWNKIKELPSSIVNLQKLVSLDLSWPQYIKSLPPIICSLQSLKHLNLGYSAIEELPEDLGQLQSLETLILFCSHIKRLPDSICMLKHLKTLNIGACISLTNLPEDLGLLESLEELKLGSSTIRCIPSSISKLKRLRKLDLSCCLQLEKLPEKLGDLECLQEVNVRGTFLRPSPLKGVIILGEVSAEEARQFLKSSL